MLFTFAYVISQANMCLVSDNMAIKFFLYLVLKKGVNICSYQVTDIEVQRGVVIAFSVIQMYEEENISPHVVFILDMMSKTLQMVVKMF